MVSVEQWLFDYESQSSVHLRKILNCFPPKVALVLEEGPLHTQDWGHATITLQALSLVKKVERVQVRFTLRSRDQQNMWMQDGCRVYMDS